MGGTIRELLLNINSDNWMYYAFAIASICALGYLAYIKRNK